eukprot:COSAG01_NODE_1130_length_11575_cov_6.349773_6_plen_54_part_00
MNFPAAVTDFTRQIDLDAQCPLALIVRGGPVMVVVGGRDDTKYNVVLHILCMS